MTRVSRYDRVRARLLAGWRARAVSFKAIAFALVGVVNTAIDYCVFLIARAAFDRSPAALALSVRFPIFANAATPRRFR